MPRTGERFSQRIETALGENTQPPVTNPEKTDTAIAPSSSGDITPNARMPTERKRLVKPSRSMFTE